jgi:hypothetical protein
MQYVVMRAKGRTVEAALDALEKIVNDHITLYGAKPLGGPSTDVWAGGVEAHQALEIPNESLGGKIRIDG